MSQCHPHTKKTGAGRDKAADAARPSSVQGRGQDIPRGNARNKRERFSQNSGSIDSRTRKRRAKRVAEVLHAQTQNETRAAGVLDDRTAFNKPSGVERPCLPAASPHRLLRRSIDVANAVTFISPPAKVQKERVGPTSRPRSGRVTSSWPRGATLPFSQDVAWR